MKLFYTNKNNIFCVWRLLNHPPANMQDRANVGHQLAGLAKRRQICQRFANVANVLPTSLQTP